MILDPTVLVDIQDINKIQFTITDFVILFLFLESQVTLQSTVTIFLF